MSKLKVGVEEAKTTRLCCLIAPFEQALVEQQTEEIVTILKSSNDGKIIIIQTLVICVDWTLNFHQNEKSDYQKICFLSLVTVFDEFLF